MKEVLRGQVGSGEARREVLEGLLGGPLAVWASTGLTEPEGQAALDREFFRALLGGPLSLGEAALRAKAAIPDQDIRATWVLLGDPALRVR